MQSYDFILKHEVSVLPLLYIEFSFVHHFHLDNFINFT